MKKINGMELAKEMLWLAWQACGGTTGMGWLQDRPGATKENIWNNVGVRQGNRVDADYVFGRMMKLHLEYDNKSVIYDDRELTLDYQSWCGTYPTYKDLESSAIASLGV